MARTCALAVALCAALLVAAAPAAARPRVLQVALPSPGDVTLMHVNFKRSVARSPRRPRFGPLGADARRMLRRARVAVVGSSMRMSRTRVIASVVLLRKKGGGAAGIAQRSLRVVVDRPVASTVTQRNVLRRRAPASPGAQAAQLGPIVCVTNEELMKGTPLRSELLFRDEEGDEAIPDAVFEREAPALAYGLYCDVYRPALSPLLKGIGSRFPVSCTFSRTYIGSATDSEGNVLTEPSFLFGLRCSKTIDELALVVHDTYVKFCEDSADRSCQIGTTLMPMDTALFPYRIRAGIDTSFVIRGEPPLQRGEVFEVLIDLVDHGQVRDEQVM